MILSEVLKAQKPDAVKASAVWTLSPRRGQGDVFNPSLRLWNTSGHLRADCGGVPEGTCEAWSHVRYGTTSSN